MRSLKWTAALGLIVGCTARPMSVVTDAGTSSLDDLLRALGSGKRRRNAASPCDA